MGESLFAEFIEMFDGAQAQPSSITKGSKVLWAESLGKSENELIYDSASLRPTSSRDRVGDGSGPFGCLATGR